ncbi:poly(U)-specific 3'-to-5' RNA exonuclease [Elasticomyces elasticus]|nr:poly(U)-specific 3'-to-5' RNA exonuclease [Elasticomyces elasticus]KAK4910369.1 poly(U)-specific 3'-to-5' RNA exonuclease [Elasticomyces elasticus]KAK5740853.1 poly(U)-specific 3'-to-5' RNA exonuclease [Elasticomyces elasticus]
MALVSYPSSSDSEGDVPTPPPAKKRKTETTLPPLPNAFRDLYSSTVRTTTSDDPSLHGGRKRVTPHVEGQWPGHVYLEWNPDPQETEHLSNLINDEQKLQGDGCQMQSLLSNDLSVSLPLHVSLSRPLSLGAEQKVVFLAQLKEAMTGCGVRCFEVSSGRLRWHPNELSTRWFLVLQLRKPAHDELGKLLRSCNDVAKAFGQPLLYSAADDIDEGGTHGTEAENENEDGVVEGEGKFHISLAWSLTEPNIANGPSRLVQGKGVEGEASSILASDAELADLVVHFAEVKVRIGQDVHSLPLPAARGKKGGLFT